MTYHVELTLQAEQDIDHILDWLRRRSPQGAATWFRRWNQVLADLSKNASSCRLAPENDDHDDEIRNLVFNTRRGKKYRALFVIRENVVFVTNVRGPGQDLVAPDELKLPD